MRPYLILGVVAALLCACGGGNATESRVQSPFTEADARLFDDGVDFIASVLALEGRWQQEWQTDLENRVAHSDAIAVVEVRTLRTDTDPHGRVTYRLFVQPTQVIQGAPGKGELELSTQEESPGFRTVHGRMERLESQAFVAFLKWYQDENGRDALHWHLSPASEEVVAAVKRMAN